VLEDKRVLDETVMMLKYIVSQKETENLMVQYFTGVF
jgi:hypothetical protein